MVNADIVEAILLVFGKYKNLILFIFIFFLIEKYHLNKNRKYFFQMRLRTLLLLIIITPLGFYSKFYNGPADLWINNSFGGLLYEMFWCLAIFFLFPKFNITFIPVIVFISTSLLEFLQLWHPPFLQTIRQTFLGRTLIGTSFVWSDFFYYFIGCIIGFVILQFLKKKSRNTGTKHNIIL